MSADLLPESFSVRPAFACDIPALVEIAAACTEAHRRFTAPLLEYMTAQPSCGVFVADARPPVGFVVVHKLRGQTGEIVAVDVAPRARDLDIGTALVGRGEEWLASNGARAIYLEVDADNRPALALYEKLGYVPREEFHQDGIRRLLMQKLVGGIGPDRLRIRK
ncbi:MAG TPA: GNAT family N-acetyltransferase [Thermoanaerobaculia bacterium]